MLVLWVLAAICAVGRTRRLHDTTFSLQRPAMSSSCLAALNTTVECSAVLDEMFKYNAALGRKYQTLACSDVCLESLQSARQAILANCNSVSDVIERNGVMLPATRVVDQRLFIREKFCLKDPHSGQLCTTLWDQWRDDDLWSMQEQCHNCTLSIMEVCLKSPFQYDENSAAEYEERKVACNINNLPTPPLPPYTMGQIREVDHSKPCNATYTVLPGDTCKSIALASDTSAWALARLNFPGASCRDLAAGHKLCIPRHRKTYVVQEVDTCWTSCRDIAIALGEEGVGVSLQSLRLWNPSIDSRCSNLQIGQVIWISMPEGTTSAYQYHTKLLDEQKKDSEVSYDVECRISVSSDGKLSCLWLAEQYEMTVEYLIKLNPFINRLTCAFGIEANRKICVRAEVDEAVPIGEPDPDSDDLDQKVGEDQQVVLNDDSVPTIKYLSEDEWPQWFREWDSDKVPWPFGKQEDSEED